MHKTNNIIINQKTLKFISLLLCTYIPFGNMNENFDQKRFILLEVIKLLHMRLDYYYDDIVTIAAPSLLFWHNCFTFAFISIEICVFVRLRLVWCYTKDL